MLQANEVDPATIDTDDEELLARFRDGRDISAFNELVHRYERPIFRYLVRYLRNVALAEDVCQTTFMRVYEKSQLFVDGRRVRPWLYSIATHQAIDELRKKSRRPATSLDDEYSLNDTNVGTLLKLVQSNEPSPLERLEEQERANWVHRAVDQLPDGLRVFVLLIFFQRLMYREVAEVFDMPIGTVKTRVHKALVKLKLAWQHDHEEQLGQTNAKSLVRTRAVSLLE